MMINDSKIDEETISILEVHSKLVSIANMVMKMIEQIDLNAKLNNELELKHLLMVGLLLHKHVDYFFNNLDKFMQDIMEKIILTSADGLTEQ